MLLRLSQFLLPSPLLMTPKRKKQKNKKQTRKKDEEELKRDFKNTKRV
jgi:hypothetical protein